MKMAMLHRPLSVITQLLGLCLFISALPGNAWAQKTVHCADGDHILIDVKQIAIQYDASSFAGTLSGLTVLGARLEVAPKKLQEAVAATQQWNEFVKGLAAGYNSCAVTQQQYTDGLNRIYPRLKEDAADLEVIRKLISDGQRADTKRLQALLDSYWNNLRQFAQASGKEIILERIEALSKQVDTLNSSITENFELQSLAGDLVNDIAFVLHRNPAQSSDLAGFRIMTPRLGSFFVFTKDNALMIIDSSGHVAKALPVMGADPNDEIAFFSLDLASVRKDFPEHLMGHLTPGDLGKSSLDFLMRPGLLKQPAAHFAIGFVLYVSNATIFGGRYDFEVDPSEKPEAGFSVYEDLFPASPYPERVKLVIERREPASSTSAPAASARNFQEIPNQGEDIERSWIVGLWSSIDPVIRSVPEVAKACRWPTFPEDLQRVPLTINIAIAVGEPVVAKGGKIGQVKPLIYRDAFDSATMVTVMRGPPKLADELWNSKAVPDSPPQQLKEIAAYLLSYWKNADDHGRETYTAVPLKRAVFLFPAGRSVWVWELQGERLSSGWRPDWISTEGTNLSKQAEEKLAQFTSIWNRYMVAQ
jgi:hypothetical protein